jgi:hypothetical protein
MSTPCSVPLPVLFWQMTGGLYVCSKSYTSSMRPLLPQSYPSFMVHSQPNPSSKSYMSSMPPLLPQPYLSLMVHGRPNLSSKSCTSSMGPHPSPQPYLYGQPNLTYLSFMAHSQPNLT